MACWRLTKRACSAKILLLTPCPGGEIGRHARLRIWCRKACRFESYPGQIHTVRCFLTMTDTSKLKTIKETPWYEEGIKFRCTECGKCCTGQPGYVWVSREEMGRIAEHLQMPLDKFMCTYVRQKDNRYALTEKRASNYDCVFLKDKKCTIYAVRPTQCRTYPWWLSNLKSKECWEQAKEICEGIRDDAPLVPYSIIQENLALEE